MRIKKRFTEESASPYESLNFTTRKSEIRNPDGTVAFLNESVEVPETWSQVATDIIAQKYFRKAGVPSILQPIEEEGVPQWLWRSEPAPGAELVGETDSRQVFDRLAGCWTYWGWKRATLKTKQARALISTKCGTCWRARWRLQTAPQWFNTGLNWAYGIGGPAQGHWFCDHASGEAAKSTSAYERPQLHACFIQSVGDDLVNEGGIMDPWVREARLFKYGSGTGSNFSKLRGESEPLTGGGRSSGLMSFLRIGDRAAGAIKSGGTTRRAAKMVTVDIDHPDIEQFINWKVTEEHKVAALVSGSKATKKHLTRIWLQLRLSVTGMPLILKKTVYYAKL